MSAKPWMNGPAAAGPIEIKQWSQQTDSGTNGQTINSINSANSIPYDVSRPYGSMGGYGQGFGMGMGGMYAGYNGMENGFL